MGNKGKQKDRREVEEWERKEEELRTRGAFGKSAMTARSPQQREYEADKRKIGETSFEEEEGRKKERREDGRGGCDGACRELMETMIREFRREREEWREEREAWRKELERAREAWKEIMKLRKEWNQERDVLKTKIRVLEEHKGRKDRKEKRDNIVIRGRSVKGEGEIEAFLKEAVKVEVKVKESFRTEGANGVTVVKLGREEKTKVMRNKKMLKREKRKGHGKAGLGGLSEDDSEWYGMEVE